MAYQVLTAGDSTIIADAASGLMVQVSEKSRITLPEKPAYCIATLYKIKGGFIPDKIFFFLAITDCGLDELKKSVDFFFNTIIETELYVKEVPPDSVFYPKEALRLYGSNIEAATGLISPVFTSRH